MKNDYSIPKIKLNDKQIKNGHMQNTVEIVERKPISPINSAKKGANAKNNSKKKKTICVTSGGDVAQIDDLCA